MRILYVVTDADIGGAERLLALLGKHRHSEDTVRLVVLMSRGTLSDELERSFGDVVYLDTPPSSRNVFKMVGQLRAQIRQFRPDVVSSHLFHADLVSALSFCKMPLTTTVHTHGFGESDHPLTKLIARAVGLLSFRFASVIPSSDSAEMRRFVAQLGFKRVSAPILNGSELPAEPGFSPRSRAFLSIARNHPVKGHDVLFGAFADVADEFPDWELRAYGPGVTESDPRMRELLRSEGAEALATAGRIQLLGPTSEPDEALRAGAALVISSLYGETSPLVGSEAAGQGVPVITSDIGNCAAFVDDPRFAVPAGDRQALATALREYARLSDEERITLSGEARRRAERDYSPARVSDSYRRVFAGLVAKGTNK